MSTMNVISASTGRGAAPATVLTSAIDSRELLLFRVEWAAISDFLQERPYVRELIAEGIARLRQDFGALARSFALEFYEDPDGGDDRQLFVVVTTDADSARVDAAFEAFDSQWWVDRQADARGDLGFVAEFV